MWQLTNSLKHSWLLDEEERGWVSDYFGLCQIGYPNTQENFSHTLRIKDCAR